ncbi:hypothetical protein TRICI_001215 [Trichomonascus ciferrii]|uniref:RGS domain-containing protein n=1 Tax=Trichomonascus ciferrii TaxID=44093 RepID=A0A642VA61_9ASCO|nr:hypothetical protein TRICI_001215 [Trichomonascus ciferrii]
MSTGLKRTASVRSKARAKDVENVFAMLLLSLPLSVEGSAKHSNGLFSKVRYPYSFALEEAVIKMKAMEVTLVNGGTTTTISCGVTTKSALSFLQKFMEARLVHCPADRTRRELGNASSGVLLQPTAKGVHFLQRYCQKNGVRAHERLLLSEYNSMKCIVLERHASSDKIIQSKRFGYLLFQRFMGPRPNVYDPFGPPDTLPTNKPHNLFAEESLSLSSSSSWSFDKNHEQVSPYSHRYFTHPDSDSLSQYYVSHSGVRVFSKRTVHGKQFEHCITGKAVVQWLIECTDMIFPQEAVDVGNLFVKYGLLTPISDISLQHHHRLVPERDALYILSAHNGHAICKWPQATTTKTKPPKPMFNHGIKMKDILDDAGLRLLFREHLSRELCEENLSFYTELRKFTAKYKTSSSANRPDLIALLYTIYNQFLAPGSPAELNLDHKLKAQLVCLLTQQPDQIDLPKIHTVFEKAKHAVFKMMEADSLPKFISSAEFQLGWSSLEI